MTKETSEEIATLAAKYMRCPQFDLVMDDADGFSLLIMSSEIKSLAASCLAQREQPEPSVPTSKIKELLKSVACDWVGCFALQNLIGEAEKEAK